MMDEHMCVDGQIR